MRAQPLDFARNQIRLVDDDELPREPRDPPAQVIVVKERVSILLGIGDPDDRVDPREKLVDA